MFPLIQMLALAIALVDYQIYSCYNKRDRSVILILHNKPTLLQNMRSHVSHESTKFNHQL
ncbi:MAG: hypothetical protein F6K21_33950 [Symploca sp. SIO2D2]|nr:hypothetical protein [Symploca sp. SIO2D2]